jgi:hypothetical protein
VGLRKNLFRVGNTVRLSVTDDGLVIECVGVQIVEDGACRNQRVGHCLAGGFADTEFDTGRINTLLLS